MIASKSTASNALKRRLTATLSATFPIPASDPAVLDSLVQTERTLVSRHALRMPPADQSMSETPKGWRQELAHPWSPRCQQPPRKAVPMLTISTSGSDDSPWVSL